MGSAMSVFFKSMTILEGSSKAYELIKAILSKLNTILKFPDSSSEIFWKETLFAASKLRAKIQKTPSRNLDLVIFIIGLNTGLNIIVLAF